MRAVITPPHKHPGNNNTLRPYMRSLRTTMLTLSDHVLEYTDLISSTLHLEKRLPIIVVQGSAAEAAIGGANKAINSLMTR